MTREMETWLSDSRVGNNGVAEHRSRQRQRHITTPVADYSVFLQARCPSCQTVSKGNKGSCVQLDTKQVILETFS